MLVGFVWLPSVHGDFSARGPVGEHLPRGRRAGDWGERRRRRDQRRRRRPTSCSSDRWRAPARATRSAAARRWRSNCTMCHGAQGMSASDAPNLAGQYPGGRHQAAARLPQRQAREPDHGGARARPVATATSTTSPPTTPTCRRRAPRRRPTTRPLPALVRVGDPLRNIAPCISCHGGVDQKLGAPWLEGMPKDYLVAQLNALRVRRAPQRRRRRRCATWRAR